MKQVKTLIYPNLFLPCQMVYEHNAPNSQFLFPHMQLNPPSTGNPIPVTHAASSLAKKTAALAIS
jgi:hypothetical protein